MSFGPPPSMYTQSALAADGRQRNHRKKVLFLVVGALLAVLLGGGAWLFLPASGDSDGTSDKSAAAAQGRLDVRETVERRPANVAGAMAFRFSVDDMSPGERYEMPGMWATDKILAKGINRTLVGFRIGTDAAVGDEEWNLRLSGPLCGVTRRVTVENRTAVLFKEDDAQGALCDRLAFVDLDTGEKLWETGLPTSGLGTVSDPAEYQRTPSVTLTRATVVVTWGGGSDAYDMDRGKRLWRSTAGECAHMGAAGGRALLVRLECRDAGAGPGSSDALTYKVRELDPRSGGTRWTYSVARHVKDVRLVSADPAVLATSAGDAEVTELISLDGRGGHRATIALRSGQYLGECTDETDRLSVEDCPTIVVGAGQVFLRSKETGDPHTANWIVGFDLATGKTVKKFESGQDQLLYPLRMSGDRLLALRESGDHISPMGLVALDPDTGEETPYLYFDLPVEGWTLTDMQESDVLVQDGRLFFGVKAATGPDKGKSWQWLVLGVESAARSAGSAAR
ncbi:hypothetical protein GCM10010358_64700 [Streptomyces minutiscleroticus]|uniref:Pyrrolo-quinoline quinone repeat domain-containing protein n=2 Tax=Streptomyces minutiscleroticus TaxID=68238 RepID=A0A918NWD7_9ACTN|nr:hypothetical protein GCM10010358_64700 [Streptomyces minutiscleroticus]